MRSVVLSVRGVIVCLLLSLFANMSHGAVLRYVIVVGSDEGLDSRGMPRPPLTHAEREAGELYRALLGHAGFTPAPRSVLLRGPTRADFLTAIDRLASQVERDRQAIPKAEILFALFYSGHGSEGSLLLRDGPLGGAELAAALSRVPADMRVGVFDACASASLSPAMLLAKGMNPIPGVDLLRDLPDDTLNASGSVWMFSSGAEEISIEDKELGGVFTHYFIEALGRAGGDGRMATLDHLWEFARARTVEYTNRLGLTQTPTKTVHTVATGPLNFAWRDHRRATLVLEADLESRVALFYGGDLLMMFDKLRGRAMEKSVPAGRVDVVMIRGETRSARALDLDAGDRVIVSKGFTDAPAPRGRSLSTVNPKGAQTDLRDEIVLHERDGSTFALGPVYRFAGDGDVVLAPRHGLGVALRADVGSWLVAASLSYGWDERSYPAWSYSSDAVAGGLRFGYHLARGALMVTPVVDAQLGGCFQEYADGARRNGLYGALAAGALLTFEWSGVGLAEIGGLVGARRSLGSADRDRALWSLEAGLTLGLLVALP